MGNTVARFMGLPQLFTQQLLDDHRGELDENKYPLEVTADMPDIQPAVKRLRSYYKVPMRDLY